MSEDDNKRVYPTVSLEKNMSTAANTNENMSAAANTNESMSAAATTNEELQQPLLTKTTTTAAPPTYDQAIGYKPAETAGPHVVVVTQPVTPYGPHPVDVQCPYCHNYSRTRLRHKPTSRTHLIALLLCLLQLYCCICIPYCISSCMNTNHYCGMCDKYLGTYIR